MAVSEEECSSTKSRSSSSAASTSVHYLAKCVLRGSVVLQVVYGRIRSPSCLDIVFGKETSIELVVIGEDGVVQSVCEQTTFGIIKDLAILHWNEKFSARSPQMLGRDLLVVISDSGKLSMLAFCNEMHRFFPVTNVQLSTPGSSRHQLGRMLAVDTSGFFIAASAYEDRLALLSVSMSATNDIIDKTIFYPSENEGDAVSARSLQKTSICGTIWSMCFISRESSHSSKDNNPVLAVLLNRRGAVLNELLLLGWNVREHAIHIISQYIEDGPLAHNIVEVPHSNGFAFLFRVGDALLMDLRDAQNPCSVYRTNLVEEQNFDDDNVDDNVAVCASALLGLSENDPMCIDGENSNMKSTSRYMCSWSWEPQDDKNPRMIFSIDTGELFMIEVSFNLADLKVNISECLYKGLPCKALLWVKGGYLAAFIEMGDGMVLKVENERLTYTSPVQNIAPILDMSVVDYHDEKHDQVFACCGVAPEGSLRIIRSGISVEKLYRTAPIYQGITINWYLDSSNESSRFISFFSCPVICRRDQGTICWPKLH